MAAITEHEANEIDGADASGRPPALRNPANRGRAVPLMSVQRFIKP